MPQQPPRRRVVPRLAQRRRRILHPGSLDRH
jgi:hypothetical protein